MKIGILGSGEVAQALALGFLEDGDTVMLGSRDPSKLAAFTKDHANASAGSVADVAAWGELLVLPATGLVAVEVARGVAPHLAGKVVIDTTLPNTDDAPVDGVVGWFTGPNESLLERLQAAVPEARFVKAFSSIAAARMVRPTYDGGPPTMFICGDDAVARDVVRGICTRFGFDVADMGTARAARFIEPLAGLWCIPYYRDGTTSQTFRLLR